MTRALTAAEVLALPAVVDLVTAGRALGVGRTKVHELARRGELPFPVMRLGSTYRVRRADLLDALGLAPEMSGAAPLTDAATDSTDTPAASRRSHGQRTTAR